ncbi:AP-4 complex subunit mu-1-like [Pezoporus wallicus]|uniref:AP-4 complex subunit mu-1-like n=1 Tax=Pezoporus wallicus TaxID=35540 RepID=UPI00254BA034|nr:AP-4 complex subunit mu-1-like [Pezoporus wallicus]
MPPPLCPIYALLPPPLWGPPCAPHPPYFSLTPNLPPLHPIVRGEPSEPGTDVAELFYRGVTALPGDQAPVFMALGGLHFVHVRHSGLYFVATAAAEASPFTLVEFLNRLVALLRDFCGPLSEKNVGGNFALVSELLEEMLDYGYIQSTAPEVLRSLTQSPPVSSPPFSLLDLGSIGAS